MEHLTQILHSTNANIEKITDSLKAQNRCQQILTIILLQETERKVNDVNLPATEATEEEKKLINSYHNFEVLLDILNNSCHKLLIDVETINTSYQFLNSKINTVANSYQNLEDVINTPQNSYHLPEDGIKEIINSYLKNMEGVNKNISPNLNEMVGILNNKIPVTEPVDIDIAKLNPQKYMAGIR